MRYLIVIILMLNCASGYADGIWKADTVAINKAYVNLMSNPEDSEMQKEFFDIFPTTWFEYVMTYGKWRSDETESLDGFEYWAGPQDLDNLYEKSDEYLKAFHESGKNLSDSVFCEKVVNLSVAARYGLEGKGDFQGFLHKVMEERQEWMWKSLAGITPTDQLTFWMYYWADILPRKEFEAEATKLNGEMAEEYPEVAASMMTGLEFSNGQTWFDAPDRFYMREMWEVTSGNGQ